MGYYLYLPAYFLHHDLGLQNMSWLNEIMEKYHPTATLYQAWQLPSGMWIMKYSSGLAMFYAPFFLIGHVFALNMGFAADGFSLPYQYSIAFGGLVYTLIGLFFFRKVLIKFFSDKISTLIILLICLGTNYFNQAANNGVMTHNILFMMLAILAFYTIKWHENQRIKYMLLIGFTLGIITAVRPNEGIVILIPLLWNITDKLSFRNKMNLLWNKKWQIVSAGFVFVLCVLPQMFYWKRYTGSWIFYSYNNAGEGFDLLSPHILNFLFSFRKGWFIYTPIILFSIFGFISLYKRNKDIFWPILVYMVINFYLISSWTCWWYAGGCFSARAIVSSYVFMALPLGYLLTALQKKKRMLKAISGFFFAFFILLNLFQTWQFSNGIISSERMTARYYLSIFGRTSIHPEDLNLLSVERSVESTEVFRNEQDYNYKMISFWDFERANANFSSHIDSLHFYNGRHSLRLDSTYNFSPGAEISYYGITDKDYAWIRAGAYIYIDSSYNEELPKLVITFLHKGQNYKYKTFGLSTSNVKYNQWNYISFDYQTPEVRSKLDRLAVYIWHRGKKPVYVDDIRVEVFEPR
ncbi:MAG: hypothetical protein WCM76_08160 [Bacteroidota bacterium]